MTNVLLTPEFILTAPFNYVDRFALGSDMIDVMQKHVQTKMVSLEDSQFPEKETKEILCLLDWCLRWLQKAQVEKYLNDVSKEEVENLKEEWMIWETELLSKFSSCEEKEQHNDSAFKRLAI